MTMTWTCQVPTTRRIYRIYLSIQAEEEDDDDVDLFGSDDEEEDEEKARIT